MTAPGPDTVLLVDDEPDLQKLLVFNLREAGFDCTAVGTGAEGIEHATRIRPSVIVLDWMLPDIEGPLVCRRLRTDPQLSDMAVLMLTARGDEADRVLGFEVGADDYVVKPFSVREVVMRVRALARRTGARRVARSSEEPARRLKWRGLELEMVRHHVFVDGVELILRPLEFKLIALFLEHPGRTYTRGELLEEAWGISAEANTRTVDTHVRRLRMALGSCSDAVETVHGFGYRLRDPG